MTPAGFVADPTSGGTSARPGLASLVGDVDEFLARRWARAPHLHRGSDAATLLTLADVDALVAESALRAPAFRLVKGGATLPGHEYLRTARIGSRDIADLIDVGRVHQHVAGGATLVLQGLQRFWPPLTRFARQLELDLTHPVQANAYITPPVAQGLRIHADAHDVFALQTSGRKHWVIYEPPAHPGEQAGRPVLDVHLQPGDCLYVPRGTLHAARTVDASSIHVAIGVPATTWADVLERSLRDLLADPLVQQSLPPGWAQADGSLSEAMGERLRDLAKAVEEIDPAALAASARERFWGGRAPLLTGQLAQALDPPEVDDATVVRRRPLSVCALRRSGDRLRVLLGDRELRMPATAEPAMRQITERQQFTVGELAPHLDAEGRTVLVARLLREGLLVLGE